MARREKKIEDTGPVGRFGADLRALKKARFRSYREMAEHCDRSASVLSQAANGRAMPQWDTVAEFVRACGGDLKEWSERYRALTCAPVSPDAYRRTDRPTAARPARDGVPGPVPGLTTPAEFIGQLAELRVRAGNRSLRWFTEQDPMLPHTTVHYLLEQRSSLPRWKQVEAFVKACGVREARQLAAWRAAWEEVGIAAAEQRRIRRKLPGSAPALADRT
jgi:hypothetical protein